MFQPAVTATSSDSLTSTLTTLTEVSSLNGTIVGCLASADGTPNITITVAGEFKYIIIYYIVNEYLSNRAPISSTHFYGAWN